MREMTGFTDLHEHSRIAWIEQEQGWVAALGDVVSLLSSEGFLECKRETTTSRRDRYPAGGLWQGIDPRTGSVASAVWVNHATGPHTLVFIEVDGEALTGEVTAAWRSAEPVEGGTGELEHMAGHNPR